MKPMTGMSFLITLAAMATPALAQGSGQPGDPGQGPPPECESVVVGPFTPPMGWELIPDRRPIASIVTWAGHYNDNPIGVHPSWYDADVENPDGPPTDVEDADGNPGANGIPDAFDWLLRNLDMAYDRGLRRLIMRLPAGDAPNTTLMASSQWWTMPEWKRDGFNTYIKDWIESKELAGDPVSLGLYAGYRTLNNPYSLESDGTHNPDPTDAEDMCSFYQNVQPWIDAGIKEYWLDNSGPVWTDMSTLQHSPNYSGLIHFGGEAVPNDGPGNGCGEQKHPDAAAVLASAFVATYDFAISRFGTSETVSSTDTELCVMLTGASVNCGAHTGDEWEFDDMRRLYEEGWVIWIDNIYDNTLWNTFKNPDGSVESYTFDYTFPYSVEGVHRLYDYGQLTAMVDFNNDGLIEVDDYYDTDYAAFINAWFVHSDGPGGYLDGDVNGDGTVDAYDLEDFIDAADAWKLNGTLVGTDLGPA